MPRCTQEDIFSSFQSSKLTLVDIGLGVVLLLINLVDGSVLRSCGTSGDAGIGVLCSVLVGFLFSSSSGALDAFSDVVNTLLRRGNGKLAQVLMSTQLSRYQP